MEAKTLAHALVTQDTITVYYLVYLPACLENCREYKAPQTFHETFFNVHDKYIGVIYTISHGDFITGHIFQSLSI